MVRLRSHEGTREERVGSVNTEPSREVRGHATADSLGGRGNGIGSVLRGRVASKESACQLLCRSRFRWGQSCGRLIRCSVAGPPAPTVAAKRLGGLRERALALAALAKPRRGHFERARGPPISRSRRRLRPSAIQRGNVALGRNARHHAQAESPLPASLHARIAPPPCWTAEVPARARTAQRRGP